MSDEEKQDDDLVHGFRVKDNGHHGVKPALGKLSEEQVKELDRTVREHQEAHITLRIDGDDKKFKVHRSNGNLSFHAR